MLWGFEPLGLRGMGNHLHTSKPQPPTKWVCQTSSFCFPFKLYNWFLRSLVNQSNPAIPSPSDQFGKVHGCGHLPQLRAVDAPGAGLSQNNPTSGLNSNQKGEPPKARRPHFEMHVFISTHVRIHIYIYIWYLPPPQ